MRLKVSVPPQSQLTKIPPVQTSTPISPTPDVTKGSNEWGHFDEIIHILVGKYKSTWRHKPVNSNIQELRQKHGIAEQPGLKSKF